MTGGPSFCLWMRAAYWLSFHKGRPYCVRIPAANKCVGAAHTPLVALMRASVRPSSAHCTCPQTAVRARLAGHEERHRRTAISPITIGVIDALTQKHVSQILRKSAVDGRGRSAPAVHNVTNTCCGLMQQMIPIKIAGDSECRIEILACLK